MTGSGLTSADSSRCRFDLRSLRDPRPTDRFRVVRHGGFGEAPDGEDTRSRSADGERRSRPVFWQSMDSNPLGPRLVTSARTPRPCAGLQRVVRTRWGGRSDDHDRTLARASGGVACPGQQARRVKGVALRDPLVPGGSARSAAPGLALDGPWTAPQGVANQRREVHRAAFGARRSDRRVRDARRPASRAQREPRILDELAVCAHGGARRRCGRRVRRSRAHGGAHR